MQLSGILFLSCCKIIVHSIFLALVSVEVKSQCIEKDCIGDHIRVVNPTTRKCISCYACLDCHVGSPSVPCGATVPDGTAIDCDGPRLRPEPSKVSTASSSATSLTSLVTSSVQRSQLITTALIPSSTPSEIIHPSSSVAHLSSSTVQTGSYTVVTGKTRNEREFPVDGSYNSKLIYIFGCISLAIILAILGLIVSRCSSNIQYQHPTGNEPASNDKQSCVTPSDRRICPVTSAGTLSCPQLQEENVNQDFQPDEALIDEIPPCSESNTEGFQPLSHQIVPHPIYVWNTQPGELQSGRLATWKAIPQIEKYATKMLEVPIPLFDKICLSLDVKRTDGRDVSLLAQKLIVGFSISDFALLQQAAQIRATTTTYILLTENFNGTVGDFVDIMKNMGRDDIICLINQWNG